MEIILPFDLSSVISAIALVGGTMLLFFAGLYIGFRLVTRFIRRATAACGGGESRLLDWAMNYSHYGTNTLKMRAARRIMLSHGVDPDDEGAGPD